MFFFYLSIILFYCMTMFICEALKVCLVYEKCYINKFALPNTHRTFHFFLLNVNMYICKFKKKNWKQTLNKHLKRTDGHKHTILISFC